MKLLVEALWALVIFAAFLACLHTLRDLGAGYKVSGGLALAVVLLMSVTWFTHWKN